MAKTDLNKKNLDSLYVGKSTIFKVFLLGGVAVISALFIWYTFDVIDKLKDDTRSQVEKYVKLWQLAANSDLSSSELQFIFDEVIKNYGPLETATALAMGEIETSHR